MDNAATTGALRSDETLSLRNARARLSFPAYSRTPTSSTIPDLSLRRDSPTCSRTPFAAGCPPRSPGRRSARCAGRVVGLVFEKPSLRTRVSFEAAVAQLGGTSLFLPGSEVGLGMAKRSRIFLAA